MLPSFIVGGIMKSGTSFLDSLLHNHPSVKMPDRSMDYSFFDDDRIYKRGVSWYESLFEEFKNCNDCVIGQISADCAFNEGSIERIKLHIPDVKLIFVVRHPIDRTYSLYWHQYSMGREYRSFEMALEREPKAIRKSYYNYKMYSYVARSRYKQQFDNIYKFFDKDSVLVVPFDSLTKDTLRTVNEVFAFIGVDTVKNMDQLNHNKLRKNRAKIPQHHSIVIISAFLQKLGLISAGRRLINMDRVDKRPLEMNKSTRQTLEQLLAEDILFYEEIRKNFQNRINL